MDIIHINEILLFKNGSDYQSRLLVSMGDLIIDINDPALSDLYEIFKQDLEKYDGSIEHWNTLSNDLEYPQNRNYELISNDWLQLDILISSLKC